MLKTRKSRTVSGHKSGYATLFKLSQTFRPCKVAGLGLGWSTCESCESTGSCGSCAAEAVLVLATRVATQEASSSEVDDRMDELENDKDEGAVCEGGRGTGPGDSMDGMSLWQVAK